MKINTKTDKSFFIPMNYIYVMVVVLLLSACQNTNKEKQLTTDAEVQQEILFVSNRDGNYEIYTMDSNGEHVKNISKHDSVDFNPSWSADGSLIYFYSERDGNAEIYSMHADGSEVIRLTDHPEADVLPVNAPDGNSIVFMSGRDTLSRNIYLMRTDGSDVRALTSNTDYEESPAWSPNGNEIVFTRQLRDPADTTHAANGEIHIMNADGSNTRRLTHTHAHAHTRTRTRAHART